MAAIKAGEVGERYYHHMKELEQIFNLLNTHPIVIMLVGPAGSGKADLIREVVRRLNLDYRDMFSHGVNRLSFVENSLELLEQLKKIDTEDFEALYIIEEMNEIDPQTKELIFSFIADCHGPSFLMTSEDLDGFNLTQFSVATQVINFEVLTPIEAEAFLHTNFPSMSTTQSNLLIELSTRIDFLQFAGEYLTRVNPDLNQFMQSMKGWFTLPPEVSLGAQALATLGESFTESDAKSLLSNINLTGPVLGMLISNNIVGKGGVGLRFVDETTYAYLAKLNEMRQPIKIDQSAKAINDSVKTDDVLDFQNYANAFFDLIKNSTPPLTVGIYGEWGTGKSFILNLIRKKIEDEKNQNLITVNFDAWTYNANEHLWIGLVQKVFDGIKEKMNPFSWVWLTLRQNLNLNWLRIKDKILPYAIIICIVLFVTIQGLNLYQDPVLENTLSVVFQSAFVGVLVSTVWKIVQSSDSEKIVELFRIDDFGYSKGLMMNIRENIKCMLKGLSSDTKIIVLIDDLDRCQPKRAVEVLEAIHLLLGFEQFIVFLAVDTRIIRAMIEKSYGGLLEDAETNGYEYLEKIVQIPFHIPRTNRSRLMRYANSLTEADPNAVSEVFTAPTVSRPITGTIPAQGETIVYDSQNNVGGVLPRQEYIFVTFSEDEQKAFRTFTQYGSRNPRRIKRQLNVYRLVRSLMAEAGVFSVNQSTQVIFWLTLNEYWPNMSSRMLELCREADDRTDITEIYQKMRFDLVPSKDNFDYDYEMLDDLMNHVGGMLTVWDIKELDRYAGNFHPLVKPLINSK